MEIDPKSVASHHLILYAFSEAVSSGTGFIVHVDGIYLLLTNYHVVSGRHPNNREKITNLTNIPDRILIPVLRNSGEKLSWFPVVQLLNDYGEPRWSEHPKLGHQFDVIALPINVPSTCTLIPYPLEEGPDIALHPSSDVSIIGFPEGMSASGITAIWKTGSIASEPELDIEGEEFFSIDANTRKGMSGAPVIARRFGTPLMKDGSNAVYSNTVDRMLGVYAGRALEASDMTLGRVWKWEVVKKLLKLQFQNVSEEFFVHILVTLVTFMNRRKIWLI